MARPEDADIVEAMRAAQTAREKIISWGTQAPGRDIERTIKLLQLYVDRKPEMIEDFAHNLLWRVIDRGILDAKTRSLALVGIQMALGSMEGVVALVANAKGAGCTEEEIMEVAYLASYQACKTTMAMSSAALQEAFRATTGVKPRQPNNENQ